MSPPDGRLEGGRGWRGSWRSRGPGGGRVRGRGGGRGGGGHYSSDNRDHGHGQGTPEREARRAQLSAVARETQDLLPQIVEATPQHPLDGFLVSGPDEPPRLDAGRCPGFKGVKIQVVEEDTLDAAIMLLNNDDSNKDNGEARRPCILNMASEKNPGGGWLNGAHTQEEAVCRRSTLILTLPRKYYPLPPKSAVYSPSVVVFRKGVLRDGHELYDLQKPELFPVVSVISAAAPRRPPLCEVTVAKVSSSSSPSESPPPSTVVVPVLREQRYKDPADRELMKEKMRVILRISAWKGHRRIVLGALGCGAFGNPKEEVARCWAEVFGETEFRGGWWSDVVFAIIDPNRRLDGNLAVFQRILHDMAV